MKGTKKNQFFTLIIFFDTSSVICFFKALDIEKKNKRFHLQNEATGETNRCAGSARSSNSQLDQCKATCRFVFKISSKNVVYALNKTGKFIIFVFYQLFVHRRMG